MRRTARLFALAEHLRARRTGVTAEALAAHLGVTVRTIYRDLDALRDAALPLHAERGPGGGYALDRAYSLPPVNFTAREAAIVLTAGRWVTELRLLPFVETLRSALDKVEAALPVQSQRELRTLLATLSFVGVPAKCPSPQVRAAVEAAWFEHGVLRIVYAGAKGRCQRRVRIENIVMERTETLLNCLDIEKGESRQFKLHLIEEAHVLEP